MIRLSLLPGIGLVGDDGRTLDPVIAQPKRLAVLAHLALAGCGTLRQRDALLALFWPDSTAERARQSLNRATHFLRQNLGSGAIVSRGPGEIGVSPDHVWCDAAAFRALSPARPEEAMALYGGDLLAGFFIDAGPEFDQWLDDERRALRDLAADTTRRLAADAERRGDLETALRWARRRIDVSGNDESAVQCALALMARAGDRSGALELYDRFAARLAQEYDGASPAPETRALVQTIRTSPAASDPAAPMRAADTGVSTSLSTVIAPATAQHGDSTTSGATERTTERTTAPGMARRPSLLARTLRSRSVRQRAGAAALGGAVLVLSSAMVYRETHVRGDSTVLQYPRIAVLALAAPDGSPQATQAASALTASLVSRLSHAPTFDIITTAPGETAPPTRSADFALGGTVIRSGDHFRIDLQLTDPRTGSAVQTTQLDGPVADVLPLVDTASARTDAMVRDAVGRQVRLRQLDATLRNPRLYAMVQEAEDDRNRAEQLDRAGQVDASTRALEDADASMVRVERAAPDNPSVHLARAEILGAIGIKYALPSPTGPARFRTLLEQSLAQARLAVARDQQSARAAEVLGSLTNMYAIFAQLSPDSTAATMTLAERSLRRAVTLDPRRSRAWGDLATILYSRADFTGAYLAAEHAHDADPYADNSMRVLVDLSQYAYEAGDDSAAVQWCGEVARRYPRSWNGPYGQLQLLARVTAPGPRTVDDAWALAARGTHADDANPTTGPQMMMLAGAVIARAGLRDSAAHVIARAHAAGLHDPELPVIEAEARLRLGDVAGANALLRSYIAVSPARRAGLLHSRRFAGLEAR